MTLSGAALQTTFSLIINRLGVAGGVLQTPLSLIHSLTHPFVQNLQGTVYPKPYEQGR